MLLLSFACLLSLHVLFSFVLSHDLQKKASLTLQSVFVVIADEELPFIFSC